MKTNRKGMAQIYLIALILVAALIIFGGANQGGIILKSNDPNVFYQYSGEPPEYKYPYCYGQGQASSNQCCIDEDFAINNIIFSNSQVIRANNNEYKFEISNVRSALYRINQYQTGTCGAIVYDAAVYKNNVLIDSITSLLKYDNCADVKSNMVERDYGDIKATFSFASEKGGSTNYCRGTDENGFSSYIINKYVVVPLQEEESQGVKTEIVANPSNTEVVIASEPGFFGNLWSSILEFFRGLF